MNGIITSWIKMLRIKQKRKQNALTLAIVKEGRVKNEPFKVIMMPPNRSGCCIICSETINWLHSTEERNGIGFHKALQILSNKNGIITSHISRQTTRLHRQKHKHGNGKLGNLYIYMTNQSPNLGNLWTRNVHHKNESQAWKSGSFQISSNLQSPAKHRLLSFRPKKPYYS
jgi:hypothetical protein